jgi:hypothetical protein
MLLTDPLAWRYCCWAAEAEEEVAEEVAEGKGVEAVESEAGLPDEPVSGMARAVASRAQKTAWMSGPVSPASSMGSATLATRSSSMSRNSLVCDKWPPICIRAERE